MYTVSIILNIYSILKCCCYIALILDRHVHRHLAECNRMQQEKSVQAAQCNKIHQLEQWFFCSLAEGNKTQQHITFVASCCSEQRL